MYKSDSKIKRYRLLLLAVSVCGVLTACSGNTDECETDSGAACAITDDAADSNPNASEVENQGISVVPFCATPSSDADGDGYGFEGGASCRMPGVSGVTPAATINDITHVIVVTGQSNVEAPETAFDAVLDQPHPRVFAFTDEGWQMADLHQVWDEHAHPGNHSLTDPTRSPNNNFTFHFAKSLAQMDDSAVPAFIVLAAPGKGISNWDFESTFYLKMRDKITTALAQIPHRHTIDVMLWHQGESDWLFEGTSDPFATEFIDQNSAEYEIYYKLKLDNVISNFRSEDWATPDLPFICGETRIAEGVNRHLMALNNNGDDNSACVATSDLPYLLSDPTGNHYSAVGLRELGRRYMQKFLELTGR